MTIHSAYRTCVILLLCAFAGQSVVLADDLDAITFGEAALSFAAGSILKSSPQDGVINVVTGDNQATGDRMHLGQRETLYLKLKNPGEVAVGDLFTVFKRSRKVFHPATGEYLGYLVIRAAIVEVTQVDKRLTTVQVIRAYGAVSPGDPVVKFALPVEAEPDQRSSPDEMTAMIVEFQSDMGVTLVAQRNLVYVDRGRLDGVQAGDVMEIIRSGGSLPPRLVGEIKILSTQDKTAAALVTKSTARILKGDRLRLKVPAAEAVPVSRPVKQSEQRMEPSPSVEDPSRKSVTQDASRETRVTLNDLMRQLRFESGEATIRPEGYKVLDGLIEHLKGAPADQLIRVEGHADAMEIGPSLKSRYPTNWDLSKARAGGVLRYLIEKGGIDSARISSVGYGDTKPVVSNATEAGRQRNRRVDIVLYAPEPEKNGAGQATTPASVEEGEKVSGLTSDEETLAARLRPSTAKAAVDEPVTKPAEQPAAETPAVSGNQPGVDRPADRSPASQP